MNENESSINQLDNISVSSESSEIKQIKNIDFIKKYIHALPDELSKLKEYYNQLMTILNEYVSLTQTYCKKVGEIANKIKLQKNDEETLESKLILILKNQFIKSSICLNKITEEIKNETNKIYKGKMNILSNLNNIKNDYFTSINNIEHTKKSYEHYMNKYEDYLINKEVKKIKNKKSNSRDSIKKKTILKEYKKMDSMLKNEKISIEINDKELTKKTFQLQEKYFNSVTESNNILKKIIDISSNEKISIRGNIISEFCSFVDKITFYFTEQKDNFLNEKQKIIPNDITNYLKNLKEEQELYNHFLKSYPYSLRCLKKYSKTKEPTLYKSKKYSYDFEEENLPDLTTGNVINEKRVKKYYKLNSKNIVNIFKEMKNNNLLLSRCDEKIQNEENDKIIIKKITKQILKSDNFNNIKDESRKTFFQKMEFRNNQIFFLKILNNYRTKGQFNINKIAFEFFGEIFKYINNICLNSEDMEIYKFVYVISVTYFYNDGKRKHFLTDYIENHIKYKNISFWINYLKNQVKSEIKNTKSRISEKEIKNNEQKFLNNIRFSCLLNVVKNMIDFHVDNEFINEFIKEVNKNYIINDTQLQTIKIYLINETSNKEENEKDEGNNNEEKDKKNEGNNNKEEGEKINTEDNKKNYENNIKEEIGEDKNNKNKQNDKKNNNSLGNSNININNIKEEENIF